MPDPVGNRTLRFLIRHNLVTFPSQMPQLSRRGTGELSNRMAQLYFLRGWSLRAICGRYGISKVGAQKQLNEWRIRAVESGYIQEIEPGCMEALGGRRLVREKVRNRSLTASCHFDRAPVPGKERLRSADESAALKPLDEGAGAFPSARVLMLCGDSRVRNALTAVFRDFGFETREASNCEELLTLCRFIRYDAVLLDMVGFGRHCIDICGELRASDAQQAILMLTDNEDQERNIEALEAGADDYVTTPFHIGEIVARVRVALRYSRPLDSFRQNPKAAASSSLHSNLQPEDPPAPPLAPPMLHIFPRL